MVKNKTTKTKTSVKEFLDSVNDEKQREDSYKLMAMMKKIIKEEPKMWGPDIVGFGNYHYKYESGHEGDMCITGFSPRKRSLTIYIMPGFKRFEGLMKKLGKYKTGQSCLYIKKLEDVDTKVLGQLITDSIKYMKEKYN